MNITLGNKIEINGEVMPDYLQRALLENLLNSYGYVAVKKSELPITGISNISSGSISVDRIKSNYIR